MLGVHLTNSIVILSAAKNLTILRRAALVRSLATLGMTCLSRVCELAPNEK